MNTPDIICYVAALILFCLDGFKVAAAVNFTPLGFAALTLSLLI